MKTILAILFSITVPIAVFSAPQDLNELIVLILTYSMLLTQICIALSVLAFVYNIAEYIRTSASSGDLDKAKKVLMWNVIALFVMVSLFAVVLFLKENVVGSDETNSPIVDTDRVLELFPRNNTLNTSL